MSTRGAVGIRMNGIDKIGYNHFDSYPTGLGDDILTWLKGNDLTKLKKLFEVSSSKPNWDLDQGSVNKLSIMQNGHDVIRALDEKRKNELDDNYDYIPEDKNSIGIE